MWALAQNSVLFPGIFTVLILKLLLSQSNVNLANKKTGFQDWQLSGLLRNTLLEGWKTPGVSKSNKNPIELNRTIVVRLGSAIEHHQTSILL